MLPTLAAPAPGAKRSTSPAAVAAMQRTETDVAHLAAPEGTRQSLEVDGERARRWLARAGLISRGVVYGVIGLLAIKVAVGSAGKAANQQGALQTIAQQPFGKAVLVVVAAGLAGYAAWRLLRAGVGHGTQ